MPTPRLHARCGRRSPADPAPCPGGRCSLVTPRGARSATSVDALAQGASSGAVAYAQARTATAFIDDQLNLHRVRRARRPVLQGQDEQVQVGPVLDELELEEFIERGAIDLLGPVPVKVCDRLELARLGAANAALETPESSFSSISMIRSSQSSITSSSQAASMPCRPRACTRSHRSSSEGKGRFNLVSLPQGILRQRIPWENLPLCAGAVWCHLIPFGHERRVDWNSRGR